MNGEEDDVRYALTPKGKWLVEYMRNRGVPYEVATLVADEIWQDGYTKREQK